jgi:hypothetical protein
MDYMSIFYRFFEFLKKRRAQNYLKDLCIWYDITHEVSDILGDALYNEKICTSEIGIVLDRTDRLLFTLDSAIPGARDGLNRHNPDLAQRIENISTNIYRLRNATVSFLVRCHGPAVFEDRAQEGLHALAYYRALDEAGFQARQICRELEGELKTTWRDLQRSILLAEQAAA